MESNTSSPSPDYAEAKPAFRKPSNDTNTRHYRRRSPIGRSSSSDRSSSPIHSREESRRDSMRRKDDERDLDRDSSRIHQGRSGDTYRKSDQKISKSSYNNHRRDTFDRRDKVIDADERHYSKSSSHSGRESRSVTRSGHAREETEQYKSKHNSHRDDKYSRDRIVGYGHRGRDKDIDEKMDYRRGDNKYSRSPVRGSGSLRDKAEQRSNDPKDLDGQKYAKEEKRKLVDHETSKQMDRSDKHPREQFKERSVFTSENEDSPAKKRKPVLFSDEAKFEQPPASGCTAADIDAARKTALKAAESVNKNLMGTGYMSADQKKKLLWGSKKSTPAEEQSIHRWDTATFSDREQQEKFNKLMSLRFRWYIWPIVGCEGRSKSGSQKQQSRERWREAQGSAARLGEAICCWPSSQRWSHCWTWSVTIATFLGCLCRCVLTFSVILCFCKTLSFEVISFWFPRDKYDLWVQLIY